MIWSRLTSSACNSTFPASIRAMSRISAIIPLDIHQFSREWFDELKRGVMQRFCVCSDVGSRHGTSERDRGLDGRHQSGAGEAAAKAAQDAAGQAGGSSRSFPL